MHPIQKKTNAGTLIPYTWNKENRCDGSSFTDRWNGSSYTDVDSTDGLLCRVTRRNGSTHTWKEGDEGLKSV